MLALKAFFSGRSHFSGIARIFLYFRWHYLDFNASILFEIRNCPMPNSVLVVQKSTFCTTTAFIRSKYCYKPDLLFYVSIHFVVEHHNANALVQTKSSMYPKNIDYGSYSSTNVYRDQASLKPPVNWRSSCEKIEAEMVEKQQNHLIFGTREYNVRSIRDTLSAAEELKVDFVLTPLFHPRLRRDVKGVSGSRSGPITRSDRELDSKGWIANVVGEISEWIDCDNHDPSIRKASEKAMRQEFAWASHLGLQALVFPMPCLRSPNFAAIIQQLCAASSYQQLWIKIPILVPLDFRNSRLNLTHITDGWEVWDSLRHLARHDSRLFCCLEMSEDLPDDLNELRRWAAEPLRAIILPTRLFLENKKGYPVLSKQHQAALSILLQFKMHVIFSGRPKMQGSLTPYIQYIQHLRSRDISMLSDGERFTFSYKDTLQSPLQPLMDNLESQTYETFERDPVKYERYEAAIAKALTDLSTKRASPSNTTFSSHVVMGTDDSSVLTGAVVIVTVVGAGRGPLVAAALSASSTTSVPIKIYAVEKNMNAVVTLRNRVLTELWTNVTVIAGKCFSILSIRMTT